MKTCPSCGQQIPQDATRCPFCDADLSAPTAGGGPSGALEPTPPHQEPPASVPQVPAVVGQGALRFSHSGSRYLLGWGASFFGIWDRFTPGGPIRTFPRNDEGWRDAWLEFTRIESTYVAVPPPGPSQPSAAGAGTWAGAGAQPAPFGTQAPAGGGYQVPDGVQGPSAYRRVNGLWWIAPILFGVLGGLVAWLVNRDRDARTARAMLVTGLFVGVVSLIVLASRGGA